MLIFKSYLSSLNGVPQQSDNVFRLTACRLEAFGPSQQDALHAEAERHELLSDSGANEGEDLLTASRPVCWQGKEKVKPRGRHAVFIPM